MIKPTQLSSSVNTEELKDFITLKNKDRIANFVHERFTERYFDPIKNLDKEHKHGFSIMAVCCLMIESLYSFKMGLEDTNGRSKRVFKEFLTTEEEFTDFKSHADAFYKNIRCGILHQSETTGGKDTRMGFVLLG